MPSILNATTTNGLVTSADNSGSLQLQTNNGTTAVTIDTSQNVGVGSTSPSSTGFDTGSTKLFAVAPNSNFGAAITAIADSQGRTIRVANQGKNVAGVVDATDSQINYGSNSVHPVIFLSGGTERMRITTGGNVGIGTSSPNNRLHVLGGTDTRSRVEESGGTFFDAVITNAGHFFDSTGTGDWTFNKIGSANMVFKTNNAERMRITSGGELLIGRTSTLNAKLAIQSSTGACSINCGDDADLTDYGIVQIVRPANQPDNKFHLSFIRGGNKIAGMGFLDNSDTFAIQNASNNAGAGVTLTNTATSWGTTSDERKKDIIAPVENALHKLADWRSVYYKYKNDEADAPQRVGLIAQDVQATLPEAISVESDEMQTLQLRYTETIPLLVKAIQELKAELDATKAEVQALKGVV